MYRENKGKKALMIAGVLMALSMNGNAWAAGVAPQAANYREQAVRFSLPYYEEAAGGKLTAETLASWWQVFNDSDLTELIGMALEENKDLAVAQSRVNQARAKLGISKSRLLPWVDGSGSWTRTKVADNSPYPQMAGLHNDAKLGVDASWEIDVFGRQKANVRASTNDFQAEQARLYGTWTSLSAETAMNYITLRTLQEKLAIAEKNLLLQTEKREILEANYRAGRSAELPVKQADYTLKQVEAEIPNLRTAIEETMNRLAILTGKTPGELTEKLGQKKPLPDVDTAMYLAIPADSLRQRPDIQAAERALAAQKQRTKAAKKDWLPRFSLFGSIGLESFSTGSLFSAGSKGFSFGPSLTLPIFHAGEIRRNIEVQTEKEKEYLAVYEKRVQEAVAEVRNALTAGAQERQRKESLQAGFQAAKDALDIADNRYRAGLSSYHDVLDAQRNVYSLDSLYTESRGQELIDMVQLFKAMGGGWQSMDNKEAERANSQK